MNKLVIPTMLVATIMIAGMFAFIPIDNASTFHLLLNQGVSGATFSESATVSTDNVSDDIVFHNFILTVDEPFTIQDITVRGEIEESDSSSDEIGIAIRAYPGEYGFNVTAVKEDDRKENICDDCDGSSGRVVEGDDDVKKRTWSMNAVDKGHSTGDLTFGPDTKIVVNVCFGDASGSGGTTDYLATVTFYLRGVFSGDDVDIEVQDGGVDDDVEKLGCQRALD